MIYELNSYIKYVKLSKSKIAKIGLYRAYGKTVKQWYDAQQDKPDLVCNASFYYYQNGALFPVYSLKIDGQILTQDSLYRGMYINGTNYGMGTIQTAPGEHFISGAPIIRENGIGRITPAWIDTLKSISGSEPRTIAGWDNESFYVLTVDGRKPGKPGADFKELNNICTRAGMRNAINLDGGGSSILLYKEQTVNTPTEQRPMYSVLAIWEQKEQQPSNSSPLITKLKLNEKFSMDINYPMGLYDYMAENFQYIELYDPFEKALQLDARLLFMLQTLRSETGWSINIESAYRGEEYNKAVKGDPGSYHTKGMAADFKAYKNGIQIGTVHVAYKLLDILDRFGIPGGIGVYMPGYSADEPNSLGFTHFDTRPERSLWVCYKKPTLVSISELSEITI